MIETTYTVTGMTCEHCVASVTEELSELPGVTSVAVDLATGSVRVTSNERPDTARVADAVAAAGYALSPPAA